MSRPVLLDVDTGIDDALALLYLALREDVEIVAAGSVHGNCTAGQAAVNTQYTFAVAGLPHIPVAVGAARPLAQPLSVAAEVHGADGLGQVDRRQLADRPLQLEAAAAQLVRLVRQSPGQITIVATGPLTNLAIALLLDPDLPNLVRDVFVMGGAINHAGNVTATAEANIWHDPEAADLVMTAGWDLTLVPLDVTMRTMLTGDRLTELQQADNDIARFASDILRYYVDAYERYEGIRGAAMHDPLAAAIALTPDLVRCYDMPIAVELSGEHTRGATIADVRAGQPDRPTVHVALDVNADRFLDDFVQRLVRSDQTFRSRPVALRPFNDA